jgi:hypothetical protein
VIASAAAPACGPSSSQSRTRLMHAPRNSAMEVHSALNCETAGRAVALLLPPPPPPPPLLAGCLAAAAPPPPPLVPANSAATSSVAAAPPVTFEAPPNTPGAGEFEASAKPREERHFLIAGCIAYETTKRQPSSRRAYCRQRRQSSVPMPPPCHSSCVCGQQNQHILIDVHEGSLSVRPEPRQQCKFRMRTH